MLTIKRGYVQTLEITPNSFLQELCPVLELFNTSYYLGLINSKVTGGHTFKIKSSYSRALAPACAALISLSHKIVLPFRDEFNHLAYIQYVVCKRPSVWASLKFCRLVKSYHFIAYLSTCFKGKRQISELGIPD